MSGVLPSADGGGVSLRPRSARGSSRLSAPSADRNLVKCHENRYSPTVAFDREKMKRAAAELAAEGVFVGTSPWKYEGWFGQLYKPTRCEYRGKVASARFERDCKCRRKLQ